jgi:hypothetical protein
MDAASFPGAVNGHPESPKKKTPRQADLTGVVTEIFECGVLRRVG